MPIAPWSIFFPIRHGFHKYDDLLKGFCRNILRILKYDGREYGWIFGQMHSKTNRLVKSREKEMALYAKLLVCLS